MKRYSRIFSRFLICLSVIFAQISASAFTLNEFESPESMVVDPQTGIYYVSNTPDSEGQRILGAGYISKISPDASVAIQKFIGGQPDLPVLDNPKGLCIVDKLLYVADTQTLKAFDLVTRKQILNTDLGAYGASALNALTYSTSSHMLYVSDSHEDKIFAVDTGNAHQVSLYFEGPILGKPNGLCVNPRTGHLMVLGYDSGQIMEIDDDKRVHVLKKGLESLDGLDYDVEGNLYVSSHGKGEIYRIPFLGRGPASVFLSGLTTPSDISFDRKKHELLIPQTRVNSVFTYFVYSKKKNN